MVGRRRVTTARSPLSSSGGYSPNAKRVANLLDVSEEWGCWMLATLKDKPDIHVELGWENYQQFAAKGWTILGTPLVYLRFDRGRQCLFEAQFRQVAVMPHPDIAQELHSLLQLFVGYGPYSLPPRIRHCHELSVQPLPERQNLSYRQSRLNQRRNKKKTRMRGVRR